MRRQRRTPISDDDEYQTLHNETEDLLQMERLSRGSTPKYRFENTIEAKVEDGDTLQALALKFHCTVADIKRLNNIERDNEIYARHVVKLPVTVHSVLLGALPTVHTSGSNSPRHSPKMANSTETAGEAPVLQNPLELSEKLMIASVNASGAETDENKITDAIFHSKLARSGTVYTDAASTSTAAAASDVNAALLSDFFSCDDDTLPRLRPIPGPSAFRAIEWSGSDCDMSWVCLFFVIMALCFIIPLVYVLYLAEHSHHHNATAH